jgi:hypothetical protein
MMSSDSVLTVDDRWQFKQQVSETMLTSVTPLTVLCLPFVPTYNGLAMSRCECCYLCVITSSGWQGTNVCGYMGVFEL